MIISFDGVSLVGKSTLIDMLADSNPGLEVIAERETPVYPYPRFLESLYKRVYGSLEHPYLLCGLRKTALESMQEEPERKHPMIERTIKKAIDYASLYDPKVYHLPFLAQIFSVGRTFSSKFVKSMQESSPEKEILLNRWLLTSFVYQSHELYPWNEIQELNNANRILTPDIMFAITSQEDKLKERFRKRQAEGVKKTHYRGIKEELKMQDKLIEVYNALKEEPYSEYNIHLIDNSGNPELAFSKIRRALEAHARNN